MAEVENPAVNPTPPRTELQIISDVLLNLQRIEDLAREAMTLPIDHTGRFDGGFFNWEMVMQRAGIHVDTLVGLLTRNYVAGPGTPPTARGTDIGEEGSHHRDLNLHRRRDD